MERSFERVREGDFARFWNDVDEFSPRLMPQLTINLMRFQYRRRLYDSNGKEKKGTLGRIFRRVVWGDCTGGMFGSTEKITSLRMCSGNAVYKVSA